MKYFVVVLLGLILGAAGAGAVLYYNPLTAAGESLPEPGDRTLHYVVPDQVLGLTLGDRALLPTGSAEDGPLWEDTVNRTALLGLVLEDATNQAAAVASRLMAGSADTDLLLSGVLLSDYWLLTIPDEGTLFVRVDSNLWPFLKQTVPVWFFGRPWDGPVDYHPTAGPGSDQRAVVIGATGRFTGLTGSAVEEYRVTGLDAAGRKAAAVGRLHLHLPESRVSAESAPADDG